MDRSSLASLLVVLTLLTVWEAACRWLQIPDFILPPPSYFTPAITNH
ncbi:MAG: hypothetical protein P8X90_15835 [Desulfobacterales bacterium]